MHAHDGKRPRKATRRRTKGQSSFSGISFPIIRAWRSAHSACIQSGIYSCHTGNATYPEGEKSSKYSSRAPRHNRPTCQRSCPCRHANGGSGRVSLTRRGHQTAAPRKLIRCGSSRVPFALTSVGHRSTFVHQIVGHESRRKAWSENEAMERIIRIKNLSRTFTSLCIFFCTICSNIFCSRLYMVFLNNVLLAFARFFFHAMNKISILREDVISFSFFLTHQLFFRVFVK